MPSPIPIVSSLIPWPDIYNFSKNEELLICSEVLVVASQPQPAGNVLPEANFCWGWWLTVTWTLYKIILEHICLSDLDLIWSPILRPILSTFLRNRNPCSINWKCLKNGVKIGPFKGTVHLFGFFHGKLNSPCAVEWY